MSEREALRQLDHGEGVHAPVDRAPAARVTPAGVFHSDEPGACAPGMIAAFVRADVVAAALLAFDPHVEQQRHLPSGGSRRA